MNTKRKIKKVYKETTGYNCPEWFKQEVSDIIKSEKGEPTDQYIEDTVKKSIHLNINMV